jgi:TatA/E family protein of Tat protein translocase
MSSAWTASLANLPIALSMPGWPETLFILVVVVLLFGAKKLPELAVVLARAWGNSRRKPFDHFEKLSLGSKVYFLGLISTAHFCELGTCSQLHV